MNNFIKNIILKKQIITIFAQLNESSLEFAEARLQILNNIKNDLSLRQHFTKF
jgi:hypothetical protein